MQSNQDPDMVAEAAKPKGAGNRAQIAFASVGRYARGYFYLQLACCPNQAAHLCSPTLGLLRKGKGKGKGKGFGFMWGPWDWQMMLLGRTQSYRVMMASSLRTLCRKLSLRMPLCSWMTFCCSGNECPRSTSPQYLLSKLDQVGGSFRPQSPA